MSASTPRICPGSVRPARMRGRRRGRPGRPRRQVMAAHRCRCHHHHRPLRQQGERGRDLEEDLRSSPAAGVFGPPRDRRGRSTGRAAATRQRRLNTAADHVTVLEQALASLPVADRPEPGRSWRAKVLVRCDSAGRPTLRRRVPGRPGWGSPSATPSTPGCATRWTPSTSATLVSGDRHRRRYPRRRLGRRGHRPGQPGHLARRDPADPAQRTPPPRSAVTVHRRRRDAGHRVHHRHRARGRARPGRRSGTAAPPARPGRGPDPRGQGHRAAQPALPPVRRQRGLAGNHPGRNRSGGLDQTIGFKTNRIWPRARSTPSATESCTSPPASPAAPDRSGCGSTPPGDGPPPSPKDGNDYGPPSPDTQFTVHSTRGPTGPGNARPPSATGRLVVPRCNNQPHKPASTDSVRTEPAARKIEASVTPNRCCGCRRPH